MDRKEVDTQHSQVRVLQPQPASRVSTASHMKVAQSRAVPRGFADMSWSRCAKFRNGSATPASCLRRRAVPRESILTRRLPDSRRDSQISGKVIQGVKRRVANTASSGSELSRPSSTNQNSKPRNKSLTIRPATVCWRTELMIEKRARRASWHPYS
jgi:hypothetical protein